MIKILDKPFNELMIGVCGFRQSLLIPPLQKFRANYKQISGVQDITSEFDIVFVSGMYKLIKKAQLDAVKYGIFGFHESPLPEGKGHAPLQWAVLHGRPNLTITLFQFTEGVDAGPIAYQYNVPIGSMDTYPEIEAKRQEGISKCFNAFLEEFSQDILVLREQSGQESYNKKRSSLDSQLDLSKPLRDLWNDIRICDNEAYPAFFIWEGKKVILRYEVTPYDNQ